MTLKSTKLPNCPRLYVGIDQSIVCTSVALLQHGELTIHRIKEDVRGPKLLDIIYSRTRQIFFGNVHGVAIEGYAYGAKGKYFNLGEVGGVIRLAAQQTQVNMIQVPPTTLKKYATGSGKATKQIMIKEMLARYELDISDDNDCDAAHLAILAHEWFETEFHCVKAYMHDLHKTCPIIVGDHPNQMDYKEYLKDMPDDYSLAEWERERKRKK